MDTGLAVQVFGGLIFFTFAYVLYFKSRYRVWPGIRNPFYIKSKK